jgi:Flp pilus assembly protein TadG
MELVLTLLHSPSFWSQTASYTLLSCFFMGLIPLLLILRKKYGPGARTALSLRSEKGSAAAIDFTLTMPIFLMTVLLAIQFLLLANASLLVHHAAYEAARAARAYGFERSAFTGALETASSSLANNALTLWMTNRGKAKDKAFDAAALVLVSASPANLPRSVSLKPKRTSAYRALPEYVRAITKGQQQTSGGKVFQRKADYAFDPINTKVDVSLRAGLRDAVAALAGGAKSIQQDEWVVDAEVSYLYYMSLPIANLLGKRQRDGTYRWPIYAKVGLL